MFSVNDELPEGYDGGIHTEHHGGKKPSRGRASRMNSRSSRRAYTLEPEPEYDADVANRHRLLRLYITAVALVFSVAAIIGIAVAAYFSGLGPRGISIYPLPEENMETMMSPTDVSSPQP